MINKKIGSEIAFGIIVLLAILIGGIFWLQGRNMTTDNPQPITDNQEIQKPIQKEGVMCTQEAKLCDDGKTYVSRTGLKCEFAQCPAVDILVKKDNDKQFLIDNVKFSLPEDLMIENIKDNIVYIKDIHHKSKYDVFLVLDRIRKFPLVGSGYEDEEQRWGNVKIVGGSVFRVVQGGAFIVTAVIVGENIYQLDWSVTSNQPYPNDMDGPWLPDSSFTQELVMEIMNGVTVE